MDLSFQVLKQYCFVQHQILLSSPDTTTTEHCFHLGPATSFLLELLVIVLHFSPGAYWTPSDLGGCSSLRVISLCLFKQFMGFSWQEYWSILLFPSSVDHALSELSTLTCLSWVALHGMAHNVIELRKPPHHDKAVFHEGTFGCSSLSILIKPNSSIV